MSDVVVAALVSGTLVLLGTVGATLANLILNYRLEKARLRDRASERAAAHSEWYRRALFERRLQAVQRAHGWLLDLNRGLNTVVTSGANPESPEATELGQLARDARAWYDENKIYLYDELPRGSAFVALTLEALMVASGGDVDGVFRTFDEADALIRARAAELIALEAPEDSPPAETAAVA